MDDAGSCFVYVGDLSAEKRPRLQRIVIYVEAAEQLGCRLLTPASQEISLDHIPYQYTEKIMSEPPEEHVQEVISFTSLSRQQAIILLKVCPRAFRLWHKKESLLTVLFQNFNEPMRAVNEYYDNADSALRPRVS